MPHNVWHALFNLRHVSLSLHTQSSSFWCWNKRTQRGQSSHFLALCDLEDPRSRLYRGRTNKLQLRTISSRKKFTLIK